MMTSVVLVPVIAARDRSTPHSSQITARVHSSLFCNPSNNEGRSSPLLAVSNLTPFVPQRSNARLLILACYLYIVPVLAVSAARRRALCTRRAREEGRGPFVTCKRCSKSGPCADPELRRRASAIAFCFPSGLHSAPFWFAWASSWSDMGLQFAGPHFAGWWVVLLPT